MTEEIKDEYTPEAAALISFSRISGSTALVDSEFDHQGYIKLRINQCKRQHSLSRTWWFSIQKDPYVDVDMSYAQFANLISNLNNGEGTPCTMKYLLDRKFPNVEPEQSRVLFDKDIVNKVSAIKPAVDALARGIEDLKISVKSKQTLKALLHRVTRILDDSLPFIVSSYAEHLDNLKQKAELEISSYLDMRVHQYGQDALEALKFPGKDKQVDNFLEADVEQIEE